MFLMLVLKDHKGSGILRRHCKLPVLIQSAHKRSLNIIQSILLFFEIVHRITELFQKIRIVRQEVSVFFKVSW